MWAPSNISELGLVVVGLVLFVSLILLWCIVDLCWLYFFVLIVYVCLVCCSFCSSVIACIVVYYCLFVLCLFCLCPFTLSSCVVIARFLSIIPCVCVVDDMVLCYPLFESCIVFGLTLIVCLLDVRDCIRCVQVMML